MNKKKIIFVMETLRMAGAEKALISLLQSMDPEKFDIDLFTFEEGGILLSDLPSYVNHFTADRQSRAMMLEWHKYKKDSLAKMNFFACFARMYISIRKRISKKRFFSWKYIEPYVKPIEKHYDVAIGFLEGYADFFTLDKTNADKKIGWIHTDFDGLDVLSQEIAYYNRFDNIVTVSDKCLDSLMKKIPFPLEKAAVVHNIVYGKEVIEKSNAFIPEYDKNRLQLVSVGRLVIQKGFDIAIQSAAILKNRGIDFQWHIYGDGPLKDELKTAVEKNNLEQSFIFEGIVANPYPYMKAADIIVQPSRWEGKSIVLDETKIIGKPIIVSPYNSVYDQIDNGVTGIICDEGADSLAEAIISLSSDKNKMSELSANCRESSNSDSAALEKIYSLIGL